MHYGLLWLVGIPTVFQFPLTALNKRRKCFQPGLCKWTVEESTSAGRSTRMHIHGSTIMQRPTCWLLHSPSLGWGLLSQFPPFRYFPIFSALSNHTSAIEYHVYIWQVAAQLSCGDTCQIWMWFEESNMYFWQVENFAYGEINERSFSWRTVSGVRKMASNWLCISGNGYNCNGFRKIAMPRGPLRHLWLDKVYSVGQRVQEIHYLRHEASSIEYRE